MIMLTIKDYDKRRANGDQKRRTFCKSVCNIVYLIIFCFYAYIGQSEDACLVEPQK